MISIATETLIPLRDAPASLPRRPNGKLLHISALYRWAKRGVNGVRLELVRIGGTSYTSSEALQRFAERLSGEAIRTPMCTRPRCSQRAAASEQLKRQLGI